MLEYISDLVIAQAQNPWLQAILLGLATFIAEDPAILLASSLSAAELVSTAHAFVGILIGIAVGDLLLYLLGRGGYKLLPEKVKQNPHLEKMQGFVQRYGLFAVLLSRFVPGMRLPVFAAAGLARMDGRVFGLAVLIASAGWTSLIFFLSLGPLRYFMDRMDSTWGIVLVVVVLIALIILHRFISRKVRNAVERSQAPGSKVRTLACGPVEASRLNGLPSHSFFEFWHPGFFYIPIIFHFAYLSARYRSIGLPVLANPAIRMGGLIGESKQEIYDSAGPLARRHILKSFSFSLRRTRSQHFLLSSGGHVREVGLHTLARACLDLLRRNGMSIPVVCKPDLGQRGDGVFFFADERQMEARLQSIANALKPGAEVRYVLQRISDYECEAGVFYVRHPDGSARVTSITLKAFPVLKGDGIHNLEQLIDSVPVLSSRKGVYSRRLDISSVPDRNEYVYLVKSGNHKQGCIFLDGTSMRTRALEQSVDRICRDLPDFYFGRLDIRFPDTEHFRNGTELQVVEINGAGAEATHIWDPRAGLMDSYRALFYHWNLVFALGNSNRKSGLKPPAGWRLLQELRSYLRLARDYGVSD